MVSASRSCLRAPGKTSHGAAPGPLSAISRAIERFGCRRGIWTDGVREPLLLAGAGEDVAWGGTRTAVGHKQSRPSAEHVSAAWLMSRAPDDPACLTPD